MIRPTFSPRPPAAYRLAEPGDTLDRVGLYAAAGVAALAALAAIGRARTGRPVGLWPAGLALALAATWHAATPGPAPDGWHGLGWRAILDPAAPMGLRLALGLAGAGLAGVVVDGLLRARRDGIGLRPPGLLVAAAVLVGLRQFEIPGVEPPGYWPRVAFDLGMVAFGLAMVGLRPLDGYRRPARPLLGMAGAWAFLVVGGVALATYHRPLARLKAVVPGRIYLSAMPTYRGLQIEQERLGFRTIINLFDEASIQGSPGHLDEIRFVRERGLRYLGSPSDGLESDRFLDETLALARNPDAWPILVHCHGCMDRSPAWMGIYRFVVEGRPLAEVFREIERHRGSRPKAVVTLQYNRKLPRLAPDRYAADPAAARLREAAAGIPDPFDRPDWNHMPTVRRVVTRIDPEPRAPSRPR